MRERKLERKKGKTERKGAKLRVCGRKIRDVKKREIKKLS